MSRPNDIVRWAPPTGSGTPVLCRRVEADAPVRPSSNRLIATPGGIFILPRLTRAAAGHGVRWGTTAPRGAARPGTNANLRRSLVQRRGADRNRPQRHRAPDRAPLKEPARLCMLLMRAIGLNLLLLGLAWIVVEFALRGPGLQQRLRVGPHREAAHLYFLARLFAYVIVAFLAACATASSLAVLSEVRLTAPRQGSLADLPDPEGCPSSPTSLCLTFLPLHQADPRAPPAVLSR